MSLSEHSVMANERAEHLPVVIFTKEIIDVDKPVPVVNILPVRFIGVPISQERTGNI